MVSKQSNSFSLVCLLIVSLQLLILSGGDRLAQVEARYLPTRADETEVEILKEIIRNLIAKTKAEQMENQIGRMGYSGAPFENVRQRRSSPLSESIGDSFSSSNGNESPLRSTQASNAGASHREFVKLDR